MQVFDIKRYSINDGPGIRITIFTKGCPLSCVWCHNPEGISPKQTKLYTVNRCIACKLCIKACPMGALKSVKGKGVVTDTKKCILCGKCAEVCPSKAMEMASRSYTTEELMVEIEKERIFFQSSGGGVTICGGEPLFQGDGLFPLLDECGRRGIHRVVDTTLFANPELVLEVAKRSEMFLVDLKVMDKESHKKYCGVDNTIILNNIRLLADNSIPFIIRIPIISGVNCDDENIIASAKFLSSLGINRFVSGKVFSGPLVELLPYHDIAVGKHSRLGTIYNSKNITMNVPTQDQIDHITSVFKDHNIEVGK